MSSPDDERRARREPSVSTGLNRRKLLGAAGVTAAVAGAAGAGVLGGRASAASTGPVNVKVPFRGDHQAGIVTPAQDRMHFCAFDVMPNATRGELQAMLRQWTEMADRMTRGEETTSGGAVDGNPYSPPTDTGEALDLAASALTLTIGFGPAFFRKDGVDRFGIADKLPPPLQELPKFRNEKLDPARCGGDICIQACADDPQVAVHAIRNLARVGFGTVAVKWSQLGFGRTSSTSRSQVTPRNLFGFKDGTRNIKAEDTAKVDSSVWVAKGDDPAWMAGGTYLVARRIRMLIESWDRTVLTEQERVIGRAKGSGAPIGQADEFAALDFTGKKPDGEPLLDVDSHVRLASAEELGGIEILRRGYNFTDGSDGFGHLDAGLFFIAFVRNPQTQFIPMQRKLATEDALNEYILHTGSAIFACPPGLGPKEYWGQALFG